MRQGKLAKDVESYLAEVPPEARAALERLRGIIRSVAPEATETISYGMPFFKQNGMLVAFAAFKDHCSFFPASTRTIRRFRRELAGFDTAKGTIRFTADHPIPAALVRKIVRARLKENEVRRHQRPGRKRT